ncbi:hypothetical protein AtubIFM57258_009114 [Aspergillus tubingensis]|nr:hypothetical protein AtubIFM57258_009114 [Aspergillus tubingensis]
MGLGFLPACIGRQLYDEEFDLLQTAHSVHLDAENVPVSNVARVQAFAFGMNFEVTAQYPPRKANCIKRLEFFRVDVYL